MNQVLETIKNRRSIRNFKTEQISQDSLSAILEAGLYAPSAHNEQPWYFTVIQNPELLQDINAKTKEKMAKAEEDWIKKMGSRADFSVTYNAPTLIIVSGKADAMAWSSGCDAAIQNMLLAAESLDIGSVWLGLLRYYFPQEDMTSKLGIPAGYVPSYGVSFGYKADAQPKAAPNRTSGLVTYLR